MLLSANTQKSEANARTLYSIVLRHILLGIELLVRWQQCIWQIYWASQSSYQYETNKQNYRL